MFKRIWLALTYGPEIDEILEKKRRANEEAERKRRSEYVQLCIRHQPVSCASHYSSDNCHVCQLQRRILEK